MLRRDLSQKGWLVPLVCALAAALYFAGSLAPLQTWLADSRFRVDSRKATGEVVLIDIDAKSLGRIGVWPWPRAIHGALTDRLRLAGARTIAFDVDFSSRADPGNDAAFAEALQRAGGGVLLATFDQHLTGDPSSNTLFSNRPHADLAAQSFPAHVNVVSDIHGIVRAVALMRQQTDGPVPAMAAMLAGRTADLSATVTIDYSIDPATVDRIPVIDLLEERVDPARIAGRAALVGASALELRDVFQTPVGGLMSGPMIQVLAAETIAQNRQIVTTRPSWAGLALLVLGAAFFLAWRRCSWRLLVFAAVLTAVGIEVSAVAIQKFMAVSLATAPLQVALAGLITCAVVREIYQRRVLLTAARVQEQHTRLILDRVVADNYAGVIVLDHLRIVRAMSRQACAILECHDLTGRHIAEELPQEIVARIEQLFTAAKGGGAVRTLSGEATHSGGANDRLLKYTLTLSRFGAADAAESWIVCLTFRDATEEMAAQARLAYLARNDVLTGLANRHAFEEHVATTLRDEPWRKIAILFFDLDRFKTINDTLGHALGDALLCAVAHRVQTLATGRGIASRFGGDEFALLLHDAGKDEALAIAADLLARLSQPFVLDNHRLVVGASGGCACNNEPGSASDLIKNADTALYRAKAGGGNKFVAFEPSMDAPLRARQAMELDLWEAFETWQFELVYQPQVDLPSGHITGAEVLLRWRHPKLGYISPADFIPVAEAVGLIEHLGRKVLHLACVEAARWPGGTKVSVNVSASQFVRGDLVTDVKEALARSGLPAARLDLEITESLFIHDAEAIAATMNRLRELGVTFSIDDFGTGYSSLSYVRQFPVDKIKIDKSFVGGLPGDQDSVAIVSAVVAMARSLDLRVNAEGVETELQADALRLLGCGEGQGWLFGKPVPAAQFEALLAANVPPVRAVS